MKKDVRRSLPSVEAVVRSMGDLAPAQRRRMTAAVREVLASARTGGSGDKERDAYAAEARALLAARDRPSLRRVINATGVILQTNLGRAPLSPRALAAIGAAAGAVSVEYDLALGRRGERHGHASGLLTELTGADDAVVTNNNAAAVLLALSALTSGRGAPRAGVGAPVARRAGGATSGETVIRKEVVVARGELIEIGGGFRIPDVLARSGAKLVEVGTTNRTYTKDYAGAITERTAALLRVHSSNFRVIGFTASAPSTELAALARERGVLFVHDLGSGTLLDTTPHGLGREETVAEAVADGADLVTFSGDKLLGGPQAGIAVGRAEPIAKLRAHPLMRAVRPDKLTLAALVATLETYRDGRALKELPVWRMIAAPSDALAARAAKIAAALTARGIPASVVATRSTVGGGSLPEETQPSHAVALEGRPQRLAEALRGADPPVVARVVEERLALDLRSVLPEDDGTLAASVASALGGERGAT